MYNGSYRFLHVHGFSEHDLSFVILYEAIKLMNWGMSDTCIQSYSIDDVVEVQLTKFLYR